MKYALPLTLPVRTLSAAAFVTALLLAATFSSVLPVSFAHTPAKTRTNKLQEPRVAIPTGTYRQANLVSDLPGVALIEDLTQKSLGRGAKSRQSLLGGQQPNRLRDALPG